MRDDQHGAVVHQALERLLDQPLALGVERRGGLVEQQDRRVLEQGPRDGQPLALAARDLHAALADHRVVALRRGRG